MKAADKLKNSAAHGGHIEFFAAEFHKTAAEVIDFSSSVNPLGLPEAAEAVYRNAYRQLSSYPEPYAETLVAEIAKNYSVPQDTVMTGNGSMALLDLAVRALKPARALLIEPCFGGYRSFLDANGVRVDEFVLRPDEGFKYPAEKICERLNGIDLLILANPNSPTGAAPSRDGLRHILERARQERAFVIIDEAFADWLPGASLAREASGSSAFLVVRSLTKFYGIAGIRAGYALGSKTLIQKMKKLQGPWACNRPAQEISRVLLNDAEFREKSLNWLREERSFLEKALSESGAFEVFPSLANFFLVRAKKGTAAEIYRFLGRKGIFIRRADNYIGLDPRYFRVSVRLREDNEKLVLALKEWAAEKVEENAR